MSRHTKLIIIWCVIVMSLITFLLSWLKSGSDIAWDKTILIGGLFIFIGWGCACIIPLIVPEIQKIDDSANNSDDIDFEFPDDKKQDKKE